MGFEFLKARIALYARMAKWPVLLVWWAAYARIFVMVLGARLGLPLTHAVCDSPFCDVSVFWQAGRMAAAGFGEATYNPIVFTAVRHALFGPGAEVLPWVYPPLTLMLVVGLAPLPLWLAYWVWVLALTGFAVMILRAAGASYAVIAVGLFSPAALWTMELGQFGLLSGAALVATIMAPRQLVAGISLGVLTFKPHGGLLAPFVLLRRRRWGSLFVGCAIGFALITASILIFGLDTWRFYVGPGLQMSQPVLLRIVQAPGTAAFGANVFGMMVTTGVSVSVALLVQTVSTLAAIAAVVWIWRDPVITPAKVLQTTLLSMIAMPYGGVDYFVGVSLALALCAQARGWRFSLTDALLFTWPALSPVVYTATGWQVTPVLLLLGLWRSGAGVRVETAPGSTGRAGHSRAVG
jgi:alpha-1,2-mannosyltransferase